MDASANDDVQHWKTMSLQRDRSVLAFPVWELQSVFETGDTP